MLVCVAACVCAGCGGGPKASSADVIVIRQPTPDPTLDAVVRDLPRALAGVVPTATPTPKPVPPTPVPKVVAKPTVAAPAPTPKPAVRSAASPTPTPKRP